MTDEDKEGNQRRTNMTDSAERLDQIEGRLEQLGNELAQFSQQLAEQTTSILTLQNLGVQLLEIVRIQQQRAEADRIEFRQQAEADREEFRNEIRQIWEYLMATQPNGRGES